MWVYCALAKCRSSMMCRDVLHRKYHSSIIVHMLFSDILNGQFLIYVFCTYRMKSNMF